MIEIQDNEIYRSLPEHPNIEIAMDGKVRYKIEKYIVKPCYVESIDMYRVCYYVNHKPKFAFIPYLVARCYVDNPDGYKYVRAKDGNKSNYHADNLEWVSTLRQNLKTPEELKANKREYEAKYRKANKDKVLERVNKWREENKDTIHEKAKEYWHNNKERFLQRYTCEVCNCSSLVKHKDRHEQSKKHIDALGRK